MRNSANFSLSASSFEHFSLPSCTVPDMSLSLRDLLDRHNAGGNVKVFKPVYTGENSFIPDNFERMDQMEKVQLARELNDFVRTARGRLVSARQAQIDKANEAAIIERYKKSLADAVDSVVEPSV